VLNHKLVINVLLIFYRSYIESEHSVTSTSGFDKNENTSEKE